MTKKGLLIVVSGPSGVGKDTVVNHYIKTMGEESSVISVSATTRAPRINEVNGRDYFFLSREEFLARIEKNEMLEFAEYNGNFYGTPKENVDTVLQQGKNVILIIEVQGAKKVRELYPEAVLVFILPPSVECLEHRLSLRNTDDTEAIARRIKIAGEELACACAYDYTIINESIESCAKSFDIVVKAAAFSPKHNKQIFQGVCNNAKTFDVSDNREER